MLTLIEFYNIIVKLFRQSALIFVAICAMVLSVHAADLPPVSPPEGVASVEYNQPNTTSLVSEVRLGLFAHNVYGGFIPNTLDNWDFSQWHDINGEILFRELNWFSKRYGTLRPALGATINLNNKENMAYLGLAYKKNLFSTPVFLEGNFGIGVHDGYLENPPAGSGMRRLGCRVQFHESASLGVDVSEKISVMATYEHTSNADLCDYNAGLSNAGIRVGFKF